MVNRSNHTDDRVIFPQSPTPIRPRTSSVHISTTLMESAKTEAESKNSRSVSPLSPQRIKSKFTKADSVEPHQKTKVTIDPLFKEHSHEIAAHFLGDAFIRSTFIQGLGLEGFNAYSLILFTTQLLNQQLNVSNDVTEKLYLTNTINRFRDLSEIYKKLSEIEASLSNQNAKTQEFVRYMQKRISEMKPGDRMLIPGGWGGKDGHLMIYEIIKGGENKKNGKNNYAVQVFNSGEGLQYHPSKVQDNKKKYIPKIIQEGNNFDTEGDLIWREYYEMKCPHSSVGEVLKEYSEKDIYLKFLPGMKSTAGQPKLSKTTEKDEYITGQRQGTCVSAVLFQFMRAECKRVCGQDSNWKKMYKNSKLKIKYAVMVQYFTYLEKSNFFTQKNLKPEEIIEKISVLKFLKTCNAKYNNSLTKAKKKGLITQAEFDNMNSLCIEISKKVSDALKSLSQEKRMISTPLRTLLSGKIKSAFHFSDVSPIATNPVKQVNLSSGRLIITEANISSIEQLMTTSFPEDFPKFNSLFSDKKKFKGISANGPNDISFSYDNQEYRIYKQEDDRVIICLKFGDSWCHLYPSSLLKDPKPTAIFKSCWCWHDPQHQQLHFADKIKGNFVYQYDFKTRELVCIDGKERNGLILSNIEPTKNPFGSKAKEGLEFFQHFDSSAQIWKDANGKPKIIELPHYGLLFELKYAGNRVEKIVPLGEAFKDYQMEDFQYLSSLWRVRGYILLEKWKDGNLVDKTVLIPTRVVSSSNELSKPLTFAKEEAATHSYAAYQLSKEGELNSRELEDNLYLANLYLMQRSYREAATILRQITNTQLTPKEQIAVGRMTVMGSDKTRNMDPRACALRLMARAKLVSQIKQCGEGFIHMGIILDEDWLIDFHNYLSQQSHVIGSNFLLNEKEELVLLENSKIKDDVAKARLESLRSKLTGSKQKAEVDVKERAEKTPQVKHREQHKEPKASFDAISVIIREIGVDRVLKKKPASFCDIAFITRPQPREFISNFKLFYMIAKHKSSDNPTKIYLRHLIAWAEGESSLAPIVFILKSVMNHPEEWERYSEVFDLLRKDLEIKNVNGEVIPQEQIFIKFLNNLYQKAIAIAMKE